MYRNRKVKIIATVGPATNNKESLKALFDAGVDVFRLNFSHAQHKEQENRVQLIREVEREYNRPIGILADLQGPKLRVGNFENGSVLLEYGQLFRMDLDDTPGNSQRVQLPHPQIFEAIEVGTKLLIDDGKILLEVVEAEKDYAVTKIIIGGKISDHKGVNVPDAILDISALTEKDRRDLSFALDLGVDWVALSFVQRSADIKEAINLIEGRAGIIAKLEKPAALECLEDIVELADAIMVARGDLGVEVPPEKVPAIQKQIVRACRLAGKPVVIATQMLDSMINAPTPTRAEASDVATAVYDGADAVMLSGESAVGKYPVEAVAIMDRVITQVESDPYYLKVLHATKHFPEATIEDAISRAARNMSETVMASALVTFTTTGKTTLRASRERPAVSILGLTPNQSTARRMALAWGVHAVPVVMADSFSEIVAMAKTIAEKEQFASHGDKIVIVAGIPLGIAGSTNTVRITMV